jgi:hypothetical protein
MSRTAATAIVLVAALGAAAAAAGLRGSAKERFDRIVEFDDRYYLPPPIWLRAFSLGYNEALADALWVKAVIYFGGLYQRRTRSEREAVAAGKAIRKRRAAHTARYITAITDLDPRFVRAYLVGSKFVLYHKRRVDRETVETAIEVLERGIEVFPHNGEITFSLGFFYYYELPPYLEDKAARRESRDRGARLLRRAGAMDDAPPYAALLGVSVLQREGLDDLVVEHLRTMLIAETDPKIRRSLERQLKKELGKAAERDIRRSRALQERWKQEMPYVSFDLFTLLRSDDAHQPAQVLDPLWLADRQLGLLDDEDAGAEEPGGP